MVSMQASNAYFKAQSSAKIHPVKLIHMMYERVLLNLTAAQEGLEGHSPQQVGENLSKAIALITELNCSLRAGDQSEPAQFLRGMYEAILIALGKVAVTKDATIIHQAYRYISRLKEIWEDTAMRENGLTIERNKAGQAEQALEGLTRPPSPCHKREGASLCFAV